MLEKYHVLTARILYVYTLRLRRPVVYDALQATATTGGLISLQVSLVMHDTLARLSIMARPHTCKTPPHEPLIFKLQPTERWK